MGHGAGRWDEVNTSPTNYVETGHYNYSGTVGAIDLYKMSALSTRGTPKAINVHATHAKDSIDLRNSAVLLRCASTNFAGPPQACYTYYRTMTSIYPLNPATGLPWTIGEINTLQAGIQIVS